MMAAMIGGKRTTQKTIDRDLYVRSLIDVRELRRLQLRRRRELVGLAIHVRTTYDVQSCPIKRRSDMCQNLFP